MIPHEKEQQRIILLGSLTAGIVHDLNNVFMGMMSYLNLLSIQLTQPTQQEYIKNFMNQ